jgi:Tol biopolymer transport system component
MCKKNMSIKTNIIFVCALFLFLLLHSEAMTDDANVTSIESETFFADINRTMKRNDFRISPDLKRLAYFNWSWGKQSVVVDGRQGKEYDDIGYGALTFSPDSKRVAYIAGSANKRFVVVDGQEGKHYDGIHIHYFTIPSGNTGAPDLIFSPDSKRVAYIAAIGNKRLYTYIDGTGEKMFSVVDHKEGKYYDFVCSTIFSPDSKHLAYLAVKGEKYFIVVDGQEGKHYDSTHEPIFSPDSKRFAYIAETGGKTHTVIDGQEGMRYYQIGALIFSPDSKHIVYIATDTDGKVFPVVDGKEGKRYYNVQSVIFTPDSKNIAYIATNTDGKICAVVAGQEGKPHYDIDASSLTFSPDGKYVAYVAKKRRKMFVVVNDSEGNQYDSIISAGFGGGIVFDNNNNLRYLAVRDDKIYTVKRHLSPAQNRLEAVHKDKETTAQSPSPLMEGDQRHKEIKGIVLNDGNVIEGQILNISANAVIIRTKDGKVLSYSFEKEVRGFVK